MRIVLTAASIALGVAACSDDGEAHLISKVSPRADESRQNVVSAPSSVSMFEIGLNT